MESKSEREFELELEISLLRSIVASRYILKGSKWSSLIEKWADGADVQIYCNDKKQFVDIFAPTFVESCIYRLK